MFLHINIFINNYLCFFNLNNKVESNKYFSSAPYLNNKVESNKYFNSTPMQPNPQITLLTTSLSGKFIVMWHHFLELLSLDKWWVGEVRQEGVTSCLKTNTLQKSSKLKINIYKYNLYFICLNLLFPPRKETKRKIYLVDCYPIPQRRYNLLTVDRIELGSSKLLQTGIKDH